MRRMFCMTSKLLHKYEYISFDIFDTLVKRDLERPADVFLVVEKKYQMQTGMAIDGFAEKRITAEKKARKLRGIVKLHLTRYMHSCLIRRR